MKDYGEFLSNNKRYKQSGVFQAADYLDQANAIEKAGYSTVENDKGEEIYSKLLIGVIQEQNLQLLDFECEMNYFKDKNKLYALFMNLCYIKTKIIEYIIGGNEMNINSKELRDIINSIREADAYVIAEADRRMVSLAKPLKSLGKLEEIAIKLAGITGKVKNNITKKWL